MQTALTNLATEVKALQDSLATAATAAEVAALQTALNNVQSDLTDLLASNNVYSDDLVINSSATLEVAKSLGNKLTILNADLVIDQDANLSAADLQAVVDVLVTTTGNIQYKMTNKNSTPVTFNKLTSAGNIYVDVAGAISFPALENVTTLHIDDTHSAYITSFSAPKLSKITTFGAGGSSAYSGGTVTITAGTEDAINLPKATAITLSALATYDAGSLTVTGKLDHTLDLAALTSKTAAGSSLAFSLTSVGAKEISLPLLTKGNVVAETSKTINLPLFVGGTDKFTGARTITLGAYTKNLTTSVALETLTFTGAKAEGANDADDEGPSVNISASTTIQSVTLDGVLDAFTANFASANTSLTSVSLTGKANAVSIKNANGLTELDLGHTAEQAARASLSIVDNTGLTSLKADKLVSAASLTITGNDALTSISFDALKTQGGAATAAASVDVSDNDLTATQSEISNVADKTGKFTSTSGMSDLKAYLTAAATRYASKGGSIYVAFDTLEKYLDIDDVSDSSAPFTWASKGGESKLEVAYLSAGTFVAGENATKAKRSWVVSALGAATQFGIYANGTTIGTYTLGSSLTTARSSILTDAALANAAAAGVSLSVTNATGLASVDLVIQAGVASPTVGERYYNATRPSTALLTTTFGFTASDTFTVSVGGQTATVSKTAAADEDELAVAIANAYTSKYGTTGAKAKFSVDATTTSGTVKFTSLDKGSGGTGLAASASATSASNALRSVDWKIGSTIDSGDNKTTATAFMVTLESTSAGTLLSEIGKYGDAESKTNAKAASVTNVSGTSATIVELAASNAKVTTTDSHFEESRADVVVPENSVASTGTKNTTNQITWL